MLDKHMAAVEKLVEKGNSQALESAKGLIDPAVKTEINNALIEVRKSQEELRKSTEEIAKNMNRPGMGGGNQPQFFDVQLEEKIKGADFRNAMLSKSTFEVKFETKAVSDMLTVDAGRLAGMQFPVLARPGILETPASAFRMRDLMRVIPTTNTKITWLQENGGEGDAGMVAEGAIKPQIDFDFTQAETTVKKVAGHIRLSEEMVEDIPMITAYVTIRGQRKVVNVENAQILYGDGTAVNLRGLNLDAVAFTGAGIKVPAPTNYDVLRALQAQVSIGDYGLSAILMNPADTASMDLLKDTSNNYILPPNLAALRALIRETTLIPAGSFLAGDFANAADLYDRKALNVRFYDQDRDNAVRNMITIVIEERLAVANLRPAAFIKGTFAAARTAMTAV